jgi:hypothetical protein
MGSTKEDTMIHKEEIREVLLDVLIDSTQAQLRALKRLRGVAEEPKKKKRGMSQVSMVYDILARASRPLHVSEILKRVEQAHGVPLDRESIVSALTKKLARDPRLVRTDKNTFHLRQGDQ